LERGEVDVHAVYCPDTGKCYFVRDDQIKSKFLSLRFVPPKAGQTKGVRMADDCLDPHVMF
jgi:hypothetical protein